MKKPLRVVNKMAKDQAIATAAVTEGDRISQMNKDKISKGFGVIAKDSAEANQQSAIPPLPTPAITKSVDSASPVEVQQEDAIAPEPVTAPVESAITADSIKAMFAEVLTAQNQKHQEEIDRVRLETQAAIDAAKAEAERVKADAEKLVESRNNIVKAFGLDKFMGNPNAIGSQESVKPGFPMVNTTVAANSDRPSGAVRDALGIIEQSNKIVKNTSLGTQFVCMDKLELKRFIQENKASLVRSMEDWGRANGMFRGSKIISKDAATQISDLPGGFLDILSPLMRETHRSSFIFWQFPITRINFAKGMGDTIQVPRAAYFNTITDPDERLLSGGGLFTKIDSGNQRIQTGTVSIELMEWGLGKDSTSPPVGIPAFVEAYSMVDLMMVVNRNLLQDYYQWEDLKVRSLWSATSRVVYNDNSDVTTTAANVNTGDDGTLTSGFLANLYGYMRSLQIPTYMDGCYGLATNSLSFIKYKQSLAEGNRWQAPNATQLQELTNILNPSVVGEMDKVTGYMGKWDNFHIFETNAFGTGIAGTEGVQNVSLGVGSTLTRSSYAFGADTIARAVGTEMEFRRDSNDDFGRINRMIWREESGFASLDVDPTGYSDTSSVPQQLRVIEVRNSDTPV
jgi:hypothetical protein